MVSKKINLDFRKTKYEVLHICLDIKGVLRHYVKAVSGRGTFAFKVFVMSFWMPVYVPGLTSWSTLAVTGSLV